MDSNVEIDESAFIWTDDEVASKQYDQIGASACGATAILNIFNFIHLFLNKKALNFEFDFEFVCSQVKVNKRIPESDASTTSLAQYLFSRSIAGMNAIELIENIERASSNKISGRFFPFYPPKNVDLAERLAFWIKKGAVPVALLNLQKTPIHGVIPDAWHHQMIYSCSKKSIGLTNPIEKKPINIIMNELTSESILLVRYIDVIRRYYANQIKLNELITMRNHSQEERKRWHDLNVAGQVIRVLRTFASHLKQSELIDSEINDDDENLNKNLDSESMKNINTTHVAIPASYIPGITLFFYRDSNLHKEILNTNQF